MPIPVLRVPKQLLLGDVAHATLKSGRTHLKSDVFLLREFPETHLLQNFFVYLYIFADERRLMGRPSVVFLSASLFYFNRRADLTQVWRYGRVESRGSADFILTRITPSPLVY